MPPRRGWLVQGALLGAALGPQAVVGLLLAVAGVVGLWAIAFFSYDLFQPVLENSFRAQGLSSAALTGKTTAWIGITSLFQDFGGFCGVYGFTYLTHYTGRRKAFALSFLFALCMTAYTFSPAGADRMAGR